MHATRFIHPVGRWTAAVAVVTCSLVAAAAGEISYNRDIRPILVENCFSCHGADSAGRQAGLRLDLRDAAVESGAIAPGDPDSSVVLDRVFSSDPDEVMPPPNSRKTLSAEQKKLLQDWIAAGAEYEPHWSFIPPVRPPLPDVKQEAWVRNPIDRFILARLEAAGLEPAPEADRRTLARRAALDITGLPPDPATVEAFVADRRPDAYEAYIDALLAAPEWGEHRGRYWLDYARYADTHGIHFDNYREMWTFRQWVIDAFNRNLPFDEFTIQQIAGDIAAAGAPPDDAAALAKRIASGFHRCNMTTNEGGVIDEEYVVLYARDRTETTATVWMGLTAGCAVCHDHKFDPITMRDFYSLSAFFNNTTQKALDGNIKDTPPVVAVPQPEDQPRYSELHRELEATRQSLELRRTSARPEFAAWLAGAIRERPAQDRPDERPLFDLPLAEGSGTAARLAISGSAVQIALSDKTKWLPGPDGADAALLDGVAATIPAVCDFERDRPFSVSLWIRPSAASGFACLVARMDEDRAFRGWDVFVQDRRVGMHLINSWAEDALKVITTSQLPADVWSYVTVSYDGSGKAAGVTVRQGGDLQHTKVEQDSFKGGTIRAEVPLTVGGRSRGGSAARGVGVAGITIRDRVVAESEAKPRLRPEGIARMAAVPPEQRLAAAGHLYDSWLVSVDAAGTESTARIARLEAEQSAIQRRSTVAHVMHEKPGMPKAHILDRGEYDKRRDEVRADTPAVLPPFPEDMPRNRLGLAQWLLLREHPLTARVTVNRFWQEVFGTGLVRTAGDFGTTGELPSHPELLDWLAVEFRDTGWDVKRLFRLMLTSAAYRQAAASTPEKLRRDADNRLLSRGPRFRMDAEMVRDQALAVSGLLVRRLGGPSVKPYQPEGVWEAVAMNESDTKSYKRDAGEGLYRRSLYWFWKRSAPPASLDIFNAPSREVCCVKRDRTNTPLQALVTLNDPQFVEAARQLADRALATGGDSDAARIAFISARLLARPLDPEELAIVERSLAGLRDWYREHPEDARQVIAIGDTKPQAGDAVQLAAWTMLANELMNLDEVLCK